MSGLKRLLVLVIVSLIWGQHSYAASALPKLRQSQAENKSLLNHDYELSIYRLPPGSELASQICGSARPCQKIEKQGYRFYAVNSNFDELDNDFLTMKVNQLQQYVVSGNYQMSPGKYFSVGFKKSGEVNGMHLFEEISFSVKPVQLLGGSWHVDVFGLFKYHLLGSGSKSSSLDRMVAFKTNISASRNFFLIAETQRGKNEPVYLAVIKQCNEIVVPSYEVKLLEKSL